MEMNIKNKKGRGRPKKRWNDKTEIHTSIKIAGINGRVIID